LVGSTVVVVAVDFFTTTNEQYRFKSILKEGILPRRGEYYRERVIRNAIVSVCGGVSIREDVPIYIYIYTGGCADRWKGGGGRGQ